MSKQQINRTLKASVFEDLFSDPQYRFELYKVLHPEDTTTTADDIETVTLSHVIVKGQYNDLGIVVGDKLIVLVEAQSTWTANIIPRSIMYLAETWMHYGRNHEFNWYGERKVNLPESELYVIYTGDKEIKKKEINLTEEFYNGKKTAIDATVKVRTYSGGSDILEQYIMFCKIFDEQRRLYPAEKLTAVTETIRICKEKNILVEYLGKREEEVFDIMLTLFTQEQAREMDLAEARREARAEGMTLGINKGRAEGMTLGINKGRAEGMTLGMTRGKEAQARDMALEMYSDHFGVEKISKYVKYPVDTIELWINEQI